MEFAVNPEKVVEALAYVAKVSPLLSQKYIAKVFFYAEKWHLNDFGRPIVADTYIAMPQGPVPSAVRDIILQKWDWLEKPENFDTSIEVINDRGLLRVQAKPTAVFDRLSKTDRRMLENAIKYCAPMTADQLSAVSHSDRAWFETERNRPMTFDKFIDDENPNRDEIIKYATEMAVVGVL